MEVNERGDFVLARRRNGMSNKEIIYIFFFPKYLSIFAIVSAKRKCFINYMPRELATFYFNIGYFCEDYIAGEYLNSANNGPKQI